MQRPFVGHRYHSFTLKWHGYLSKTKQDVYARFLPIKALYNFLSSKLFTRTVRYTLARGTNYITTEHAFPRTHAIIVSYWPEVGPTLSGMGASRI